MRITPRPEPYFPPPIRFIQPPPPHDSPDNDYVDAVPVHDSSPSSNHSVGGGDYAAEIQQRRHHDNSSSNNNSNSSRRKKHSQGSDRSGPTMPTAAALDASSDVIYRPASSFVKPRKGSREPTYPLPPSSQFALGGLRPGDIPKSKGQNLQSRSIVVP